MAGLIILLVVAVIIIAALAYQLFQKRQQLKRYQAIIDLEAEQQKIQRENQSLATETEKLKREGRTVRDAVNNLRSQLASLEDEQDMSDYGLYQPKYDFGTSTRFKAEIDNIRQKQKQMVRDKTAILWKTEWSVEGSKAKGRSMMNQQSKLSLFAFNGECDSLILKVKYNNFDRIRDRIYGAYSKINKLGQTQNFGINPDYLDLKINELHLVHEYQMKLEAEKEEQRQIREQMREEQRAQKELERAQKEAERDEERYQRALEKARLEMAQATGEKQAQLEKEIELLNQKLAEAHENKERAISRAQMTRSGHVYIISNIGSFGEDVYKIGMTRRLEPLDRVRELGDASVPYLFDVHTIIYSDDAPTLENQLHQVFDERRINLVNPRKEFFKVNLDEIVEAVKANHGEIEFTKKAEAAEYRQTRAILANRNGANQPKPAELYEDVLGD